MDEKEVQAALEAKAELKRVRLQSILNATETEGQPGNASIKREVLT